MTMMPSTAACQSTLPPTFSSTPAASATSNVSRAYLRVFESAGDDASNETRDANENIVPVGHASTNEADESNKNAGEVAATEYASSGDASLRQAAGVFARHLAGGPDASAEAEAARLACVLREEAEGSLSPRRALSLVARVAASLDKSGQTVALDERLATEAAPER